VKTIKEAIVLIPTRTIALAKVELNPEAIAYALFPPGGPVEVGMLSGKVIYMTLEDWEDFKLKRKRSEEVKNADN